MTIGSEHMKGLSKPCNTGLNLSIYSYFYKGKREEFIMEENIWRQHLKYFSVME